MNFSTAMTCFFSCSSLTLISHLVAHQFFQSRAGCCRAVLPGVPAACCFWRALYYCLARALASGSEGAAGKLNRAQHFPMKAWLPRRGKSAPPSEACLPVYREENKKWFSLFSFHAAVLQLTSPVKWSCCVFIWNVFFTYSSDFLWMLIVYLLFPSTYVAE